MELYPAAQPDLSLRISPPNTQQVPSWRTSNYPTDHHHHQDGHDDLDLGDLWKKTLSSQNHHLHRGSETRSSEASYVPNDLTHYSSDSSDLTTQSTRYHHQELRSELGGGLLAPIRGVPTVNYYRDSTHPDFQILAADQYHHHQTYNNNKQPSYDHSCTIATSSCSSSLTTTTHGNNSNINARSAGRLFSSTWRRRFVPAAAILKRSIRAPRMRWTTTLHARFVHAVHLLGGHQRATPKSVLELMDVRDLTLAHVKSHLQMYRTVKTTDKVLVSGQSEVLYEKGSRSSGRDNNCDDIVVFDSTTQSQRSELSAKHGGRSSVHQVKDFQYCRWSNSSREVLFNGEHAGDVEANIPYFEKEMNSKGLKNEGTSVMSSSSHSETSIKKPNLEFTLGRAN